MVGGPLFGQQLSIVFGLIPARITAALAGQATPIPAFATFITYMFLHSGWLHLGLNMLFMLWVGRYVEWVTGRWSLVAVFMIGGTVGGIAQFLASHSSISPVVGASGAIAAVFGAYAIIFARSRAEPRTILGITLSGELLTSLWYAATWIGLQFLTGLAFNDGKSGLEIAIWTHIGGFLAGLVMGRLWGRGPQIG